MDLKVLEVQKWLNLTYGNHPDFPAVTEDGLTGNSTIKALIRGLQIEAGVKVDGVLGSGSLAAIGTISPSLDTSVQTNRNKVYIAQGGLYCKGYNPKGFDGIYGSGMIEKVREFETDAGFISTTGNITPKLLKAILNTENFRLDEEKGDHQIRTIQQALNRSYSNYMDLIPCNGIYGKFTNKGLIRALQHEIGETVDGVFGSGTMSKCPTIKRGGAASKSVVLILQYALCCNKFNPNQLDGVFGAGAERAVKEFQEFVGLIADGIAGKDTWASLLTSSGNPNRKGTGCDRAHPLTKEIASALAADGRKVIGRYIGGGLWKRLKREEIEIITETGMDIFPIYQTEGNHSGYFTSAKGRTDAATAISNAQKLGFPSRTTIYFCVDFDALETDIKNSILPYFEAVFKLFSDTGRNPKNYKVGVYGPRNVCIQVSDKGYAISSFVSDMSTGYSGNLGYLLPSNWMFDQISTVKYTVNGSTIEIDNLIVSKNYRKMAPFDPEEVPEPESTSLFKMDNAVLSEKDRNIEIALECINYRLKEEEKAKDTVNSIKFDLQEIRRKDEYQYCYENFGDDKGRFIFPFPTQSPEEKYTLKVEHYEKYTAERIKALNGGGKLAEFASSFFGTVGSVLSYLMKYADMERNGEDVTLKQLIYNAVDIFVPGTDVLLKNLYFLTLSEKEDILFSTLYTVLSNDTLYHDIVTDSTPYYITPYNYRPGDSGSGDDGQKSFKIYAGDSLVQVSVTKGGKHLGDYYVYLRDYIPRCVWYYKATI